MKTSLSPMSQVCLVIGVLFGLMNGVGRADNPTGSDTTKVRETIRAERPDHSRGWVIVAKESYWPLCYESLDRIEEARKLFGTDDKEQLVDVLEKCEAWLRLAASAAMTDGNSGVIGAADMYGLAADLIRTGDPRAKQEHLNDLTTLGLISMAKSHVLRAGDPDTAFQPTKAKKTDKSDKKVLSEVAAANREILAENLRRLREQYRLDAVESRKHLVVAQTYLTAAAESGGFTVDAALTKNIPAVPAEGDLEEYVDDEIRTRVSAMLKLIDSKWEPLNGKLEESL